MKSVWYHGTHLCHLTSIEKEGLRVSQDGIWGLGVYLTDSLEDARGFGDTVLVVELQDDMILHLDYAQHIPVFFPYLSFEEEEAEPKLGALCIDRGFPAFSIRHADGTRHLIVNDPSLLKVTSVIFQRKGGEDDGATDCESDGRTSAARPQLETSGTE